MDAPEHRYMMSVMLADATGQAYVTVFNEQVTGQQGAQYTAVLQAGSLPICLAICPFFPVQGPNAHVTFASRCLDGFQQWPLCCKAPSTRPILTLCAFHSLSCAVQGATLLGCSADEAAAKQENDPEAFKRCVGMMQPLHPFALMGQPRSGPQHGLLSTTGMLAASWSRRLVLHGVTTQCRF